jgi:prolyl-tRNA editing enzyme YbaK/EbsC (Cys-tRNA(Pro) deacylase)
MPKKSNVLRLLESHHSLHQAHIYAPAIRSAEDVAHGLGIPASEVCKSLVVLPPHGKLLLMIIPGPLGLDLKRLAETMETKKRRVDDFMSLTPARLVATSIDRGAAL